MPDTFRKTYTPLTEAQQEQMKLVKEKAEELEELIKNNVHPDNGRLMSIAQTHLETAIMFAVKGITS